MSHGDNLVALVIYSVLGFAFVVALVGFIIEQVGIDFSAPTWRFSFPRLYRPYRRAPRSPLQGATYGYRPAKAYKAVDAYRAVRIEERVGGYGASKL
jgi:hypothetical protein